VLALEKWKQLWMFINLDCFSLMYWAWAHPGSVGWSPGFVQTQGTKSFGKSNGKAVDVVGSFTEM